MYTIITILIILTCVLLVLIVLVQNPKGGGLSTGLIGSGQVMGVKKTTDFIEKLTWGLALTLVVLCLLAGLSLPNKEDRNLGTSMQEQIDNSTNAPAQNVPSPGQTQPGQNQQGQPQQGQPQQGQPQQTQPQQAQPVQAQPQPVQSQPGNDPQKK